MSKAVDDWNDYAREVNRRENAAPKWRWEFDRVAMTLSFGGLTAIVLLCDKQSQQTYDADIDVDAFIAAQEDLGEKLAQLLNANKVRPPLALATVELNGAQQ